MATLLLIVILLSYIGLGLPDSLFGAAWPAVREGFSLPLSFANFVNVTVAAGTFISSLVSAAVVKKLGTAKVTALSTLLCAAALFGYGVSGSFWALVVCAVPLGLGAGAVDAALNNYLSLHYPAAQVSFLHCFYGVGICISPYILSRMLDGVGGWQAGYRLAATVQLGIALVLFGTLPVWRAASAKMGESADDAQGTARLLSLRAMAAMPGVPAMWCLFLTSCAVEWSCGNWGASFLVSCRGLDAAAAAGTVLFYYIGMTLGRLISGLLALRWDSLRIARMGRLVLAAALAVLFIPGPAWLAATGLFLVGVGNGPLFTHFSLLVPRLFGRAVSQSVMGTQMAASALGVMLAPAVCGWLAQAFGMGVFPWYLAAFWLAMQLAALRLRQLAKLAA